MWICINNLASHYVNLYKQPGSSIKSDCLTISSRHGSLIYSAWQRSRHSSLFSPVYKVWQPIQTTSKSDDMNKLFFFFIQKKKERKTKRKDILRVQIHFQDRQPSKCFPPFGKGSTLEGKNCSPLEQCFFFVCLFFGVFLSNITKTSLFKYTENFTTKKRKFSDKNSDICHISAQNIDCRYLLELPQWDNNNNKNFFFFLQRKQIQVVKKNIGLEHST